MSHVRAFRTNGYPLYTGFPKKDARFSKLKNIPYLLSDEKEGKIMENINFSYFINRASFMGNSVSPLFCPSFYDFFNHSAKRNYFKKLSNVSVLSIVYMFTHLDVEWLHHDAEAVVDAVQQHQDDEAGRQHNPTP